MSEDPRVVRTLRSGPVFPRPVRKSRIPRRKLNKANSLEELDNPGNLFKTRSLDNLNLNMDNFGGGGEQPGGAPPNNVDTLRDRIIDLETHVIRQRELLDAQREVLEALDARPQVAPACILDPVTSVPTYDASKTTPMAFTLEIEEYLTWKNVDKNNWLLLVSRIFVKDSDIARWWRETKATVKTWDEFKIAFSNYESSGQSKDKLYSDLFAKRQNLSEAFETFAWDVSGLYRKIDPAIDVQNIIERIVNSALPELSVILRNFKYNSVAELVFKTREVIVDINKVRKVDGKSMLRAKSSDPVDIKPTSSYGNRFNQRKWHNSKPSQSQNSQTRNSGEANSSEATKQQPESNSSSNSSGSTSNPSSANQTQGRNKTDQKDDMVCFYCKKKGHVIKNCDKRINREKYQASRGNTSDSRQGSGQEN